MAVAFQNRLVASGHDLSHAEGLFGNLPQLPYAPCVLLQPARALVEIQHPAVLLQHRRVGTQAHAGTVAVVLEHLLLTLLDADHLPVGIGGELTGRGALDAGYVPGVLDDRQLHAVAQPQVRHLVLSGEADRSDDPVGPPLRQTLRER